ncbi:peptide chain release factor N(5)-glutamine methyltransferase [Thiomonas sp.]|uniref:peptide chain release factor N(5)-glutamine methyltransferase n=1 Tax=Thiomonas sp. TaxID=2047785 RepID=UPI00260695F0|nr:peptide chain release factor N(5)-glutamine methyltransferase [Thiomonas sp.]
MTTDFGGPRCLDGLERLRASLQTLPDKPEETPESALRALWCRAAGLYVSVQAAQLREPPPLDAAGLERLDTLIARRLAGEPLAYLLERQRFMELELLARPSALIPRRETEMLGEAALELLRQAAAAGGSPCCIDVCCGSGNLALAMARAVPAARVHGADLSAQALDLARENAVQLGLEQRVHWHEGDLLAPFDGTSWAGTVDVLISAPPYISSARLDTMPREIIGFEPAMAFDGGAFGVGILMRLLRQAPELLRAGGWLCVEVGLGQGSAMTQLARRDARYDEVRAVRDDQGHERVLLARRAAGRQGG